MAYVLKNEQGEIVAASAEENLGDGWQQIEPNDKAYLAFLEGQLNSHSAFRESDIQLARVLEDLINILIERNIIQFTDFPSAAQKRLNDRQSMRRKSHQRLSLLGDDFPDV
ncbi:MAG: hypothetical protein SFU55_03940 [Methylophilus sp.]|nr:hypothetical protein [Methylophilus sp.]